MTAGNAAELRKQAESRIAQQHEDAGAILGDIDTRRLLNELQIHKIELEMQNEELNRAMAELESQRLRFFELYDLAPVGYCTLDERGVIIEANLTAATLLSVARGALINHSIRQFIHNEDQALFDLYHKKVFETNAVQTCEMRTVRVDGSSCWVCLRATPAHDHKYWITLTDITECKHAIDYEHFSSRILELLTGEMHLQNILDAIARGLEQLNPSMLCIILLLDNDGGHLRIGAAPNLPDFFKTGIDEIGIGIGLSESTPIKWERTIVDNISTNPHWAPCKEHAAKAGLVSCWLEPIRSSTKTVLGSFVLFHQESRRPTEYEISIVERSVRLACIAIDVDRRAILTHILR